MPIAFILKRLALAVPTLIGVAVIVFVLMRVVPGDPIAMMIPPGASQADVAQLRALYGLDAPIWQQFLRWSGEVLQGDFGTSISLRRDVGELILTRLPATLELAAAAIGLAVALGVGLALLGCWGQGGPVEVLVDGFAGLTLAIPDFLWGLIFILLLGVAWPMLPISGRLDPRIAVDFSTSFYLLESLLRGEWRILGGILAHLVLPAVALALPLTAAVTRLLKSSLQAALQEDYAVMARARGFGRWNILLRQALQNAAIPTVTLGGVQLTFLIGGTVLIERIFSYPGIGNMAIGAVVQRDLPLIQGLVLTFAVIFIVVNLLVDLSYAALNPRLRR